MTLSKEIGDREYEKFKEDRNGNTAVNAEGAVELVDGDGNPVLVHERDNFRFAGTSDVKVQELLREILIETKKTNELIETIFCEG